MTTALPRTAVVHLVRHANGLEAFERFMAAYERHDAGVEHDLVLLLKGFPDAATSKPYLERAASRRPLTVAVSDVGFDLTAYAAAARALPHERLCFLNSFSIVLAPKWLALLDAPLQDPQVGAAGASGSWGSHLSYPLYQVGLPGPYARAFPGRRTTQRTMHAMARVPNRSAARDWVFMVVQSIRRAPVMPPFPAPHLRTNAFLTDRSLFASLTTGRLRSKEACYRFEGGRRSLTTRLRQRGLEPVVVARDGTARRIEDWHAGDVFWQGDQQALLVADNQTAAYEKGSNREREVMSAFAWGPRARPATRNALRSAAA